MKARDKPTARPVRGDRTWPLYFSTRDIDAPRLTIRKGQPFPIQDKTTIKGLGGAAGCTNSWKTPFASLPYVTVLDVHSEDMARQICERGLDLNTARELLEGSNA